MSKIEVIRVRGLLNSYIAIYFEKFRIFLKPWKYTGIFLAQPSNERMLYDIKIYYDDYGIITKLTLDL